METTWNSESQKYKLYYGVAALGMLSTYDSFLEIPNPICRIYSIMITLGWANERNPGRVIVSPSPKPRSRRAVEQGSPVSWPT